MVKCPWVTANPLVDTNCLIIRKGAFRQMVTWVLGEQNQALGWDQVVWRGMIESGLNLGFLDQATVAYRTNHAIHYQYAGETPPPGATITVSVPRDQLAGT